MEQKAVVDYFLFCHQQILEVGMLTLIFWGGHNLRRRRTIELTLYLLCLVVVLCGICK